MTTQGEGFPGRFYFDLFRRRKIWYREEILCEARQAGISENRLSRNLKRLQKSRCIKMVPDNGLDWSPAYTADIYFLQGYGKK